MRLSKNQVRFSAVFMLLKGDFIHAASVCNPDAYCVQIVGQSSYCKSYLSVPVCFGSSVPCVTCGTTVTTPVPSTTTTQHSTTPPTQSSAKSVASVASTVTTPITTIHSNAAGLSCDAYCNQFLTGSYCKTWGSIPVCTTTNVPCGASVCGSSAVTQMPPVTVSTPTPTSVKSQTTVPPTGTNSSPTTLSPVPVVTNSAQCEIYIAQEIPLFIWIEGPQLYTKSEFVAFYQKVLVFLQSNCAYVRPTTLTIRTAHPYYVPNYDMEYWPPETSPLFTELLSKLNVGSPVNVLMYPYIFDSFSRSQWVKFATSGSVDTVLPRVAIPATSSATAVLSSVNIYDGIFQFVKGWQQSVAKLGSNVRIDGFVIDYEEVSKYPDSTYIVNFTPDELNPYRALYPTIKVGTTMGYDDTTKMAYFDGFIDYLYLEAYDLYYPYAGVDSTSSSLFLLHQDDPVGMASVLAKNVFTPAILSAYQLRPSKIYVMWSTQSLLVTDCLYKLNNGSCGVNNEFGSWRPDTFNLFIQAMQKTSSVLANVQHGVYTLNFVQPTWLPINSRGMP